MNSVYKMVKTQLCFHALAGLKKYLWKTEVPIFLLRANIVLVLQIE